jgi:IS1 family transposase
MRCGVTWGRKPSRGGTVLAYVLGRRKDEVFLELQGLLEPFGITRFYTDGWGAYERYIDPATMAIIRILVPVETFGPGRARIHVIWPAV